MGNFLDNADQQHTLIESWDGSAWSIVPSPNTGATDLDFLTGVSCSSRSSCTAVGYYLPDLGSTFRTLVESWDGRAWSIVPSPNTSAADHNFLTGVSCHGPRFCMAVGDDSHTTFGGGEQTLVESWNGKVWSIVPSPNALGGDNALLGVSCPGRAACTAVGHYNLPGHPLQTLIESWDGATWTVVPSANTSPDDTNLLNGVSCRTTASCTTVGSSFVGSIEPTLIESWNGVVWSIRPSPNVSGTNVDALNAVSCAGARSCTAVGSASPTNTGIGCPLATCNTLIESWNGSAWSIDPSPNPSPTHTNDLNGVSCRGPRFCVAVGDDNAAGTTLQTLVESK